MPNSTRSNKETQLLFSSDPASLKRSIRKGRRSSSIDINASSSINTRQPPSTHTPILSTDTRSPPSTEATLLLTDIFHLTSIDTLYQTSIDTEARDMVATLVLVRDQNGNMHDKEGHLRNAAEADLPKDLFRPSLERSNKPPLEEERAQDWRDRSELQNREDL
ncbi:hypothetical protein DY000_02025123 [Brassica cretica]|uniref:Uncharacterized protein n=1 Tax=Brassica cretica TaxID=69181 RepID=A0ABQ7EEG2_BRACR|nr:hypothetical protein DY000_02025123 [Brassica cretica]